MGEIHFLSSITHPVFLKHTILDSEPICFIFSQAAMRILRECRLLGCTSHAPSVLREGSIAVPLRYHPRLQAPSFYLC